MEPNQELIHLVNSMQERIEKLEKEKSEISNRLDSVVANLNGMIRYVKNSVKPIIDIETRKISNEIETELNKAKLKELYVIYKQHNGKPTKDDFTEEQYEYLQLVLDVVKKNHPNIIHNTENEIRQMLDALSYMCVILGVDIVSVLTNE